MPDSREMSSAPSSQPGLAVRAWHHTVLAVTGQGSGCPPSCPLALSSSFPCYTGRAEHPEDSHFAVPPGGSVNGAWVTMAAERVEGRGVYLQQRAASEEGGSLDKSSSPHLPGPTKGPMLTPTCGCGNRSEKLSSLPRVTPGTAAWAAALPTC